MSKWTLELVRSFPYGVRVVAQSGEEIMAQRAAAFSTAQESRDDNEAGVGFPHSHETQCTAAQARAAIATQDANARLIAAAPELLHACELIAQNAPLVATWLAANDPAAFAQVNAAIAKATGGDA